MKLLRWVIGGACAAALLFLATPFALPYFIFRPEPLPQGNNGRPPSGAEAVEFPARDGSRLTAWWVRPNGRAMLLILHGRSGNVATRKDIVGQLAEQGFGVLAVDYRGYGASEGYPSEAGFLEDAETAYSWLITHGVKPSQIVIVGQSLGNSAAIRLASHRPVAAVALISPFTSLPEAAAIKYRWLPTSTALWWRNRFEVQDYVAEFQRPLFLAVARHDELIARSNALAVVSSAQKATLVESEGPHDGMLRRMVEDGALQHFTAEVVRREGPPG